ncbi:MAG: hypothetical protein ACYDEN_00200 [Acidimicrobiales bacterium]
MVRDVLREVLADARPPVPATGPAAHRPAADGAFAAEPVRLATDADLDAFVRRLLHLFDNPKAREELRSGRLRFRLAGPGAASVGAQPVHRVPKGAVTEAVVRRAASDGARLVLGPDAVLTPLGRDRARADGVAVEKEERC